MDDLIKLFRFHLRDDSDPPLPFQCPIWHQGFNLSCHEILDPESCDMTAFMDNPLERESFNTLNNFGLICCHCVVQDDVIIFESSQADLVKAMIWRIQYGKVECKNCLKIDQSHSQFNTVIQA
jgi:hypothetical protein